MRSRYCAGLLTALLATTTVTLAAPHTGAFQFRLGGFFPEGDSSLWSANESIYTLDASDFNGAQLGMSYVYPAHRHVQFGFNLDFFSEDVVSSDRDFVDEFGDPILHGTELDVVPVSVDVRFVAGGRDRSRRGRWSPSVYAGFGAGFNLWSHEEVGEFIDDSDPSAPFVFFDRYDDEGAASAFHLLAGFEIPIERRVSLLFEARKSWSEAEVDESYTREFLGNSGDLDLGGTSAFGGVSIRF